MTMDVYAQLEQRAKRDHGEARPARATGPGAGRALACSGSMKSIRPHSVPQFAAEETSFGGAERGKGTEKVLDSEIVVFCVRFSAASRAETQCSCGFLVEMARPRLELGTPRFSAVGRPTRPAMRSLAKRPVFAGISRCHQRQRRAARAAELPADTRRCRGVWADSGRRPKQNGPLGANPHLVLSPWCIANPSVW